MKKVSLRLSEAIDAQLTALIHQLGMSKAAVIRAALEAYLAQERVTEGTSFLDAARDRCGCVDGPPDLSTQRDAADL